MSNLPSSDKKRISVYPNEYITNSTINRPNIRLLENDLYLETLWNDAVCGVFHIDGVLSHESLCGVTTDQHHPQNHSINSHDTNATGGQLNQLVGGGDASVLHYHGGTVSHGISHANGSDPIPNADVAQLGLMTPTQVQTLNDTVLMSTNQTINSDKVINGDIRVNGTFTATDAVFITTEIIGLSANFLDLNSNETGVPSEDAGINVNRGTSTDSVLKWNETSDRWEAGLVGSSENIILNSDYSDINVLNKIKNVDGSGSGLDADLLDGHDSSYFQPAGNPPAVHAFAGSDHSASTLANVNSKISDATLIDTSDSRLSDARTPLSHSIASHDTDATGAELDTLTNGSNADSLHSHSSSTPAVHAFAGSDHSASTLANVNSKISDATLIDTSDSRLPTLNENNALAGSYGSPSSSNKYVTETDPKYLQTQMDFFIAGTYGDDVNTRLLRDDMDTYVRWNLPNAKLISVSAVHKTVDSGTEPYININLNGSNGLTSNLQLGASGTWVTSTSVATITISTGNYIDIQCMVPGGTGDAENLTVSCTFEYI